MVAASKGVVISASWYGKFKTVFQMIAIVMFTVKDSYMMGTLIDAFCDMMWVLSWAVMFVALALTIVSMLDYISKARDLIGLGPRKGKKAKASRGEAESKQVAQEGNGGIAKASDEAKEAEGIEVTDSQLESLAASVLSQARQQGLTVGTAESLTGGIISAALTAVPGSSDVMRGGVVSYAVSVKESELAVSEETVDKHGVVSCQVAEQMAVGGYRNRRARRRRAEQAGGNRMFRHCVQWQRLLANRALRRRQESGASTDHTPRIAPD